MFTSSFLLIRIILFLFAGDSRSEPLVQGHQEDETQQPEAQS